MIFPVSAAAMEIELAVSAAYHNFVQKPLPEISVGYGYGASINLLPFKSIGLGFGAVTTTHDHIGGYRAGGSAIRIRSDAAMLFIRGHYRFLTLKAYEFDGGLCATYNSINGGDSSGSYLDLLVDSDDIGYSGWGMALNFNLKRRIQAGYFVLLSLKYNFLTYSTHQRYIEIGNNDYISIKSSNPEDRRRGSSFMINLGIAYKINFARF
jgi:hypothetical protein